MILCVVGIDEEGVVVGVIECVEELVLFLGE